MLTGNSAVVVHVHERQDADEADLRANRERLRSELVIERQNQFFTAYMENAKARIPDQHRHGGLRPGDGVESAP